MPGLRGRGKGSEGKNDQGQREKISIFLGVKGSEATFAGIVNFSTYILGQRKGRQISLAARRQQPVNKRACFPRP
jgi:hypothetical protein